MKRLMRDHATLADLWHDMSSPVEAPLSTATERRYPFFSVFLMTAPVGVKCITYRGQLGNAPAALFQPGTVLSEINVMWTGFSYLVV
jgi:hypothetical protein